MKIRVLALLCVLLLLLTACTSPQADLTQSFTEAAVVADGVTLQGYARDGAVYALAGEMTEGATPVYTGLDKVRFKSPVRPGDLIETECRLTRAKPPFYFAEGEGYVGDRLCVKAEFSFAVTERREK